MPDLPSKLDSENAMSLEEAEAMLLLRGINPNLIRAIEKSVGLGKHLIAQGELDYAVGTLVEDIELLRSNIRQTEIYFQNTTSIKEKILLLERQTKNSNTLALVVKELVVASRLATERRQSVKTRTKSFMPEQIVTAVQVNVNTTEKPAS